MDDIVIDKSPELVKEKQAGLSYDVQSFEALDSTSEQLKRLAIRGAEEGTAITALAQTKGHGRYGREWFSAKGNFHLSFLLRPKEDIRKLSQLSFVVAVALGRVIKSLLDAPENVQYKWPNDLLINGKKVAGILLESSMAADGMRADWLIVGIGVNMVYSPSEVPNVTNLTDEDAYVVPDKKMLERVLKEFSTVYLDWQKNGFDAIRQEWLDNAAYLNKEIKVNTANENYIGIFEGLNKSGELILGLPDNKKRLVSAGEVFFTR